MWPILSLLACSATLPSDPADEDSVAPTTDTGGAPEDTAATGLTDPIEATLGGLRWELPCVEVTDPTLCTTVDEVSTGATLEGEPGRTYTVTVRLRGVVEPKTYTGGVATGPGWSQGGTPAADTANIYALVVSDPPAVFYVNAGTTRAWNELWAEAMDISVPVPMTTGATVTLEAASLDALQIRNVDATGAPIVIPDVPPAPEAYDGQFIQMDVVAVR